MMNYMLLIFTMFMSGMFIFVSLRKHLLSMLLSLEFIMLSMFLMMFVYLCVFDMEMYLLMMFLIFVVCEGALGLSILVSMIRTHGNNYFQSFNVLLC